MSLRDDSRLLLVGEPASTRPLANKLRALLQVNEVEHIADALERLRHEQDTTVCFVETLSQDSFFETARLLEHLPAGVAVLADDTRVLWHNKVLTELCALNGPITGEKFLEAIPEIEIVGPDFCPLHTALGLDEISRSVIKIRDKRFIQLDVVAVRNATESAVFLVLVARDVTSEVIEKNKLDAIYNAGLELGDLQPQDVREMSQEERIDLLKSRVLHYTKDVLEYETVEIRLVDPESKFLKILLSSGMQPLAQTRELYAREQGQGVTGFVACTGRSYLCEDTTTDPLYLPGALNARSSLTVPLILHDQVLGTFNVESPRPGAFAEQDLKFLALFAREVAIALNTLNLLEAEHESTAERSSTRMLRDVSSPVDEILNDSAWLLEKYIGHDPPMAERLQRIVQHTRQIREVIQTVGQALSPESRQSPAPGKINSKVLSKRVLVADDDPTVRQAAHELLERQGCIVETAHNGEEAILMSRRFAYDVVLADVKLPDMNGAECYRRLHESKPKLPIILMTGFGYDATHSLVKARQMGMKAALYKPFRLDQLVKAIEDAIGDE